MTLRAHTDQLGRKTGNVTRSRPHNPARGGGVDGRDDTDDEAAADGGHAINVAHDTRADDAPAPGPS